MAKNIFSLSFAIVETDNFECFAAFEEKIAENQDFGGGSRGP